MNENDQWVCEKCEEKCSCPSDNWPQVSYLQKREQKIRKNVVNGKTFKINTSSNDAETEENNCSIIKKLLTDESLHRDNNDRDHYSPEEASNVKDKIRQFVYTVKENGTKDNSTRELKEQTAQNKKAIRDFNADEILPQGYRKRETRKIDQMSRNECFHDHKSCEEIEDESNGSNRKLVKNNICHYGCESPEEKNVEEVCLCGCGETVKLRTNEAINRDDCDFVEPCNLCSYELLSGNEASEIKSFDETSSKLRAKEEIIHKRIPQVRKSINFQVIREICGFLLLSWNMPENISEMCGYEIRVNRNIVAARVRSPTRTETVIGPLDLSGSPINFPGLIILTLYAVGIGGEYTELSNLKIRIVNNQ